jgi:hypothetical protein
MDNSSLVLLAGWEKLPGLPVDKKSAAKKTKN